MDTFIKNLSLLHFLHFCQKLKYTNRILTSFLLVSIITAQLHSQSCYHPFIDTVISKVSQVSLSIFEKELTGEIPTVIGGEPATIYSRYWKSEANKNAAQYIFGKFRSYGFETQYWKYNQNGNNIIAIKPGTKYPRQKIIFCAHYDNYVGGIIPDTTYGADDNASGTSAVLEAARILRNYEFDYTIIFAAWDEEEIGLFGSEAYADTCFKNRDSIIAVINLDMIGWDGNNDGKAIIGSDSNSFYLSKLLQSSIYIYEPSLVPLIQIFMGGSDQSSFQRRGYKAILLMEDNGTGFNPYYHTVNDRFNHFNEDYFVSMTRSAITTLLVLQKDLIINFEHTPLQSTTDTTVRIVSAVITSNHRIIRSPIDNRKTPRLYYKIGDGPFSYSNAYYVNRDTFRFQIPSQSIGTKVSYYIAAQDSLDSIIGSLPAGARGVDPPGTIPPAGLFTYYILGLQNLCSNTLPKVLPTRIISYDSIIINQTGKVSDMDVNLTILHSNDTDIAIWVLNSVNQMIKLSMFNGGTGDNYISTIFDDEANIPITEGFPPYTGSYKPQEPLSSYNNSTLEGIWRIRILNYSNTEIGQLINWCLNIQYYDPLGINNNQVPVKSSISQNYPNPFNSSTSIQYSVGKQSDVKIIIYDVLGRELRTLINGKLSAGNYSLSFNVNDFSSGLYFYSMYINGTMFETKKMLLIK